MFLLYLYFILVLFGLFFKFWNRDVEINKNKKSPCVVIVGSGISGICMAITLKKIGFTNFTIYESSNQLGGTWYKNTYPGAEVDIPSHLYSFSFEPKIDWTRAWSTQPEILEYIQWVVKKYELMENIHFDTEVLEAKWDEKSFEYKIKTKNLKTKKINEVVSNILISGVGQLSKPKIPNIDGINNFEGEIFHSAQWNHNCDLKGKNIAVIGSAASAIQFIPEIEKKVKNLYVFQRTPNYILSKENYTFSKWQLFFFRVTFLRILYRWYLYLRSEVLYLVLRYPKINNFATKNGLKNMEKKIKNEKLKVLIPNYPIGCKRILLADNFFDAVHKPHVDIITSPIDFIEKKSIRTRNGKNFDVDVIICGTGFNTVDMLCPIEIIGKKGQSIHSLWKETPYAFWGMTVPDFPNFFVLYGPNTNIGHNSIIFIVECQCKYISRIIAEMVNKSFNFVEVKSKVMSDYQKMIDRELENTIFSKNCESWYRNKEGKVVTNTPYSTVAYWWNTLKPNFNHFLFG